MKKVYNSSIQPCDKEPLGHIKVNTKANPKAYILIVDGVCLEPEIVNGSHLLVEPTSPKVNEVGIFWSKEGKALGAKYIVSNYEPKMIPHKEGDNIVAIINYAQLNPPVRRIVTGDVLGALHRVVGVVDRDGNLRPIRSFDEL